MKIFRLPIGNVGFFASTLFLGGALSGCAGGATIVEGPVDAVDVVFGPAASHAVDDTTRETRSVTAAFVGSLSASGHSASAKGSIDYQRTSEERVLGVDGKTPKKIAVTYISQSEKRIIDGHDKSSDPDVRVGKTYVIDATNPQLDVTTASGEPVSTGEKTLVLIEYRSFGSAANEVFGALPNTPLHPGQSFNGLCDSAKHEAATRQVKFAECSIVFRGRRGDNAVFAIKAEIDHESNAAGDDTGAKVKLSLGGEVLVRIADRQWSQFAANGQLDIEVEKGAASFMGNGDVQVRIDRTYGHATK